MIIAITSFGPDYGCRVLKYRIPRRPLAWWNAAGKAAFKMGKWRYTVVSHYDLINQRRRPK